MTLRKKLMNLAATTISVDTLWGRLRDAVRGSLPWLSKGPLAIADQGIFAGSNFLLTVLLARWLTPKEYGTFAFTFSALLILNVLHNSFLTDPMLVFGPSKYNERFSEYLGVLLRGHFLLTLPCAVILVIMTSLFARWTSLPDAGQSFWGLAAGAPFILLLWLLRRAFYVQLHPGWSAASGVVYLGLLVGIAFVLHGSGHISPALAFLAMGVASLVASLLLLPLLRPSLRSEHSFVCLVAADHWRYGKWIAVAAAPTWVMENVYYLVLPMSVGFAEVGAFKALLNLAMPATNTIVALGILLVPAFVRDRDASGVSGIKRTMERSVALFLVVSGCYLVALVGFRSQIFHVLYADKYTAYASWPLFLVALIPMAQSITNVTGAALRALERPRFLFCSSLAGGITSIAFGVPLVLVKGVCGAIMGIIFSAALTGGLAYLFFIRATRHQSYERGAEGRSCI